MLIMNHDESHSAAVSMNGSLKVTRPFPIGQMWRRSLNDELANVYAAASPVLAPARDIWVILDTTTNNKERKQMAAAVRTNFNGSGMLDEGRIPEGAVPSRYSRARFVLSAFGKGFDCHRTWEAIAAGAVPIVRWHDGLAPLFEKEPVLVVREWKEVTPALLRAWKPPTGSWNASRKLWSRHWYSVFRGVVAEAVGQRVRRHTWLAR